MSKSWDELRTPTRNYSYPLSPHQVVDIRLAYGRRIATQKQLADWYGVSEQTVNNVLAKDKYLRDAPARTMPHHNNTEHRIPVQIAHYQYDFAGSNDLLAWAERVTQQRHRESVARALGGR